MPTLSQCKILTRILVKKAQESASQFQDSVPDDQETPEVPAEPPSDNVDANTGLAESCPELQTDQVSRTDPTRERRVRSAKSVRIADDSAMRAVPEVEDLQLSSNPAQELDEPTETTDTDVSPNSPQDTSRSLAADETTDIKVTVKPCLKRGTSCFFKRPDSRSKSVTFGRPSSGFYPLRNAESLESDSGLFPAIKNSQAQSEPTTPLTTSREGDKFPLWSRYGFTSADPQDVRTRPSSCGPVFRTANQITGVMQKFDTARRKGWNFERRFSCIEPNLSGVFSIRRGSIINRTLFPISIQTAAIKSTHATPEPAPVPYEPYIIKNCRLIRRDSAQLSPPYKDEQNKEETDFRRGDEFNDADDDASSDGDADSLEVCAASLDTKVELPRWSKEKQAIIVDRPVSAVSLPAGTIVQKLGLWNQNELLMSEETQQELQKLGFRKPSKAKRKKKAKGNGKGTRIDLTGLVTGKLEQVAKKIEINLQKDPVLIKVSKKNRNVGKFLGPPEPQPNAVCFEVLGTLLNHSDVKQQLGDLLKTCPEVKLVGIKFDHRAIYNSSSDMYNRWIITTSTVEGRNRLSGGNLTFGDLTVQLRRYDDVINSEYQQFTRMRNFVKMMNHRKILGGKFQADTTD
ncbi:uncharacterized protein LOC131956566 [Physella acuta]|uniref:uncharacterized protein LOC131956566 n=1 Tax=Physella acuta TaxID=109671 RepID=UPI0027DE1855|nr:uncharacterized protein LOC131956566 [Physella acuta]